MLLNSAATASCGGNTAQDSDRPHVLVCACVCSHPLKARCCHRQFHAALPQLLRPEGVYSFFQGFSADNACFHDVCCRVVASELDQLGLDVQYIPLPVDARQLAALGSVSNSYWKLDTYLLPVCQWKDEGASIQEAGTDEAGQQERPAC